MTPADVRERLNAYLDDRMSPAEAREFLAWLESHPEAWKEAEAVRRVWALLGAYRDEPVPEGFADRVLAKASAEAGADRAAGGVEPVASRPALRLLAGGRARALAAAAAILAALGVGALLGRGLGDRPPASPVPDAAVAALDAMPSGVLDQLDGDTLTQLASLSDAEFSALLLADPQDLATSGN